MDIQTLLNGLALFFTVGAGIFGMGFAVGRFYERMMSRAGALRDD